MFVVCVCTAKRFALYHSFFFLSFFVCLLCISEAGINFSCGGEVEIARNANITTRSCQWHPMMLVHTIDIFRWRYSEMFAKRIGLTPVKYVRLRFFVIGIYRYAWWAMKMCCQYFQTQVCVCMCVVMGADSMIFVTTCVSCVFVYQILLPSNNATLANHNWTPTKILINTRNTSHAYPVH